ncbi:hypothetical protein [Microbulbifer litoralis]|uniref:hypothetical protein n=1 Tax=Microbulbifer litoralis TaxID=2933965 RepID=UPI0020284A53|nr:hypothetical protein [Microbulbifer sp. GX H0434]
MSFFAALLLTGAASYNLTTPIPPDLDPNPPVTIYDSEDLYDDEPSIIAMDRSAVRHRLNSLGFDPITEMHFEGGRWKVRAYWMGKKRRLEVDEISGQVISDRPDR